MPKMLFAWATAAAVCWFCSPGFGDEPKGADEKPEAPAASIDFLEQARAMNADGQAKPPTEFRAGHVKLRKFDSKAIRTADSGFTIQLPSRAPISTPTVAGGRLFVSGGFHSKEFYAFDAKSGDFLWGIDIDDDGPSSAVVEDDVVVFNTESCTIFAVDAKTGKQLWSLWLGDPLMSTPAIAKGRVFTSYPAAGRAQALAPGAPQVAAGKAPTSHVFCALDLKTGKLLWQRWIDADVMTAPVVTGGKVYAATFAGTVYEFAPATGRILAAKRYRATSAPTVVDGEVFVTRRADTDGKSVLETLSSFSGDGRVRFQAHTKVARYLDARIQRGAHYAEKSAELDAANGFAGGAPAAANGAAGLGNIGQGNVSSFQAFQGSRALRFGAANFNTMGDELVCTDARSGATCWSVKIEGDLEKSGGFLATSPAAAGGSLFVATLDGRVLQIEPKQGKITRTFEIGAPIRFQPAVHTGRIYVGTQDGRVVMVDTGDRKYTGWTTWGGNAQHTGVVQPTTPPKPTLEKPAK